MTSYRRVVWWASTLADLKQLPAEVQRSMGHALRQAQDGGQAEHAKRMTGALRDVVEIVEHDETGKNSFRVMYTTAFGNIVYVLDAFKKKSKRGIATPARDLDRIELRLKAIRRHHATKA